MSTDAPHPTEAVSARIRTADLERLDQMAARQGVDREVLIARAIDAFLAKEMWSGGFIKPPPAMEVPPPYPHREWLTRAFGNKRR